LKKKLYEMDWTARGQVLQVVGDCVLIHLIGMEEDIREDWIPIPPAMPQWARRENAPVFRAKASIDDATEFTFEYLRQNPECLRDFTCKPISKTLDWLFDDEEIQEKA
jgi:hypothetical protein